MVTENIDKGTTHSTGDTSHADHPSAATYFKVAMALCVLTALEVVAFQWIKWLSCFLQSWINYSKSLEFSMGHVPRFFI